ncbi:HBS1-like protein [Sphaceloma murrayae]|uniref:HBS1-like protein n=1 Tax=Sphaceloma murrayae TaxID=2082308 RepID=A0A2K1QID8_9PEZI|nr:HBS1-like protein [Sphaceloma murrayae]
MAKYRRSTNDLDADLAYGGDYSAPPNRWDRERFDRIRLQEREREQRPARVDVIDERQTRHYERDYERAPQPRFSSRVRREVFDEDYARETSDRALLPYRRKEEVVDRDVYIDIERRREAAPPAPRPGLLRRQSSLDTFDRRPQRYDREEYRGALEPIRRSPPPRRYEDYREEIHYHNDTPLEHRDVEIYREREIHKKRGRAKSDLRSVASSRTSTTRSSDASTSRSSSPEPVRAPTLPGKKGHTKLPKGKFTRSAIAKFGIPFDEEDDFYKVHRALDKESIDKILLWSKETREPKVKTYTFESDGRLADKSEHYESIRTEWINPPSVRGASPARSSRTVRAPSPPPPPKQETKVVIEERVAPPPQVVYQQPAPQVIYQNPVPVAPPPPVQPMALQITERTERTHADIESEIKRLELERELVRIERGGRYENQLVVRQPVENYQVVEYSPRHRRSRSYDRIEFRDRSPPRNVVRVEKDRRDKKPNPKYVAAMMATLS